MTVAQWKFSIVFSPLPECALRNYIKIKMSQKMMMPHIQSKPPVYTTHRQIIALREFFTTILSLIIQFFLALLHFSEVSPLQSFNKVFCRKCCSLTLTQRPN